MITGPDGLLRIIPFIIIGIIVIAGVVFINEGQRRIPVHTPAAFGGGACTRARPSTCR